ncbi:MAG TPA: family 20 glycosylhydrolase, partial [Verrucomicrobiae bacterium]|nr:family 20 glycosylhydrolase [Verrucomicrobiae bacterium]
MNLLPTPRSLTRRPGSFHLPKGDASAAVKIVRNDSAPDHPEGYTLIIRKSEIEIAFREIPGLRAAMATLRQLFREYGIRLPCVEIRDWPDFARRGVMLDISRGRVPRLETLLDLAERLADFKINELQLYTEHTFAYRKYKSVWHNWGALTADEIRQLDARCRQLGIDLVPNQNSFGHLRYFLEHPPLRKLAEVSQPYEDPSGEFVRRPSTLAPNHAGTIPFLRGLYNELLPNFSSQLFNVGCDETWDLGRGQSKELCRTKGKGPVYLDFLQRVHREVSKKRKRMMFWGD